MATRFLLPSSGAAGASPAFGGWGVTGQADRVRMVTASVSTPLATRSANPTQAAVVDVLIRQYVSDPLNAGSISGTVKGIVQAYESASNRDMRAQLLIRVVSNDGATVRGTLLALNTGAVASEFSDSVLTSRKFPLGWTGAGATLSAVTAQAGDRIVVEIGYRMHLGFASSFFAYGQLRFGDTGSDLAEDETSTSTTLRPWIEFSQTLSFDTGQTPPPPTQPPPVSTSTPVTLPRATVPWQVFLCDLNGNKVLDVTTTAADKQIDYELNAPSSLTGTIDSRLTTTLLADGYPVLCADRRTVKAYRKEGSSYVLRFAGIVETVSDAGDATSARSRFVAFDPMHMLGFRLCRDAAGGWQYVAFTAEDAAQIVRVLIDRANAIAKTGVTTDGGTFQASTARTVKFEAKMIRPAVLELARSDNGFDWSVDPIDRTDGVLGQANVYVKRGVDKPDVVFAWKDDQLTAASAGRDEDAGEMANAIVGLGGTSQGGSAIATGWREDATSLANAHRREAVVTYADIIDSSYLTALADYHLGFRKNPKYVHRMVPLAGVAAEPFTGYYLGDTVRSVAHQDLRGGFTGVQRVYGFTVALSDDGIETVSVVKVGADA